MGSFLRLALCLAVVRDLDHWPPPHAAGTRCCSEALDSPTPERPKRLGMFPLIQTDLNGYSNKGTIIPVKGSSIRGNIPTIGAYMRSKYPVSVPMTS